MSEPLLRTRRLRVASVSARGWQAGPAEPWDQHPASHPGYCRAAQPTVEQPNSVLHKKLCFDPPLLLASESMLTFLQKKKTSDEKYVVVISGAFMPT